MSYLGRTSDYPPKSAVGDLKSFSMAYALLFPCWKGVALVTNTRMDVSKDEVLLLRRLSTGQALYGLSGMLWITQEGDSRDHLLVPGGAFRVQGGGRVVVQALKTSRLLVTTTERLDVLEAVKSGIPSSVGEVA